MQGPHVGQEGKGALWRSRKHACIQPNVWSSAPQAACSMCLVVVVVCPGLPTSWAVPPLSCCTSRTKRLGSSEVCVSAHEWARGSVLEPSKGGHFPTHCQISREVWSFVQSCSVGRAWQRSCAPPTTPGIQSDCGAAWRGHWTRHPRSEWQIALRPAAWPAASQDLASSSLAEAASKELGAGHERVEQRVAADVVRRRRGDCGTREHRHHAGAPPR